MVNSEHQMARMGGGRPVPRFEIVHKPHQSTVTERRLMDREPTVVAHEPNPQPWHARFIGGNGEEIWRTSETYVDVRDAEHAIALLAEVFGSQALLEGVKPQRDVPRPEPVPVLWVEVGP